VVVAIGLRAAIFARDRLPRTPLVFCVVPNFERHELTAGWITGVSNDVPPLTELTALRAAAPDVRRVGLLYGRDRGPGPLRQARAAAAAAGLTLIEAPLADLSELPGRARDLVARVDALWMPPDPTLATPEAFRFLLELSLQARKPLLVFSEALVRAGALVAVFPDYEWVGARAADGVRRIQAGERAGDIPVVPLRQTRVILNQSTARALGRDLPPTALHGAEVLQ
jgi:putative ABC transport system substrate-binding protein